MLSKTSQRAKLQLLRAFQVQSSTRSFAAATPDLLDHLKKLGITNKNIVHNPSVGELYEYALQPEHIDSVNPHVARTTITDTGALSVSSG